MTDIGSAVDTICISVLFVVLIAVAVTAFVSLLERLWKRHQ